MYLKYEYGNGRDDFVIRTPPLFCFGLIKHDNNSYSIGFSRSASDSITDEERAFYNATLQIKDKTLLESNKELNIGRANPEKGWKKSRHVFKSENEGRLRGRFNFRK